MSLSLTPADKEFCLKLARTTLVEEFSGHAGAFLQSLMRQVSTTSRLREPLPCFVSLHSRRGGRLRGCIGNTATDCTLLENVARFAQAAAFEDPRFRPVTENEVADLAIEISVLGPLRPLASLDDIIIGTHGLKVSDGRLSGLLLAQVAKEYGWSREEFARQTCVKAGLDPEKKQTYAFSYFEQIEFSE